MPLSPVYDANMPLLTNDEISTITIQLSVVEEDTEKLTEWEARFVESVSDQFHRNQFLSEKQRNLLRMIYEKVV